MSEISKFQRFTVERWERVRIEGAPYNPRKISKDAAKKLKANLEKRGLLQPVVVNGKTGRLVSGHQRLAALDALEGGPTYSLDVAVVSLTDKAEREQNLFMNNQSAMGEWDIDALAAMLPELNLEGTGFDRFDLDLIFEGPEFESLFNVESKSPSEQAVMGELLEVSEAKAPPRLAMVEAEQPKETDGDAPSERSDAAKAIAGARQNMTQHDAGRADAEARYLVLVFDTMEDRMAFAERIGEARDARYVGASRVLALVD